MNKKIISLFAVMALGLGSLGSWHLVNADDAETTGAVGNEAPTIAGAAEGVAYDETTPLDRTSLSAYGYADNVSDLVVQAMAPGTGSNGYTVVINTGGADTTGVVITSETASNVTLTVETDGAGAADPTWSNLVSAINSPGGFLAIVSSPFNGSDQIVTADGQTITLANGANGTDSVDWDATGTDNNGDNYYSLVCATNTAPTVAVNGAPSCADLNTEFAVSTSTASTVLSTTATYVPGVDTTLESETCTLNANLQAESCPWYAFVCDHNSSSSCSSPSQGSGASGSTLVINNRPMVNSFATITDENDLTIEPGDDVKFVLTVYDFDTFGATTDTVDVYVCATADFTGGTCAANQEICSIPAAASGATVECDSSATNIVGGYNTIPTSHGTKTAYIYAKDSHGLEGSEVFTTNTYSVTDTYPYVDDLNSYSVSDITLIAGQSTQIHEGGSYTITVRDDNGDGDFTNGGNDIAYLYLDGNFDGGCSPDQQNCYLSDACTYTNISGTNADTTATLTCTFTDAGTTSIQFNALDGDWYLNAQVEDENGLLFITDDRSGVVGTGVITASPVITVNALSALNVVEAAVAFEATEGLADAIALGGTSVNESTTIQNYGNQVVDMTLDVDDMCTDYPTCVGTGSNGVIPAANIEWGLAGFTHSSDGYDSVNTGAAGAETAGCSNVSLAVRAVATVATEDVDREWAIFIPTTNTPSGSYTGSITFSTIADGQCSGTN